MQKAKHYGWILAGLLAACSKSDSTDDENNGNWRELSELAGKPRSEAVAFSIGDTAYIATGYDGDKYLRDLWKYNPANGWSQLADLPAEAAGRSSATAMVLDGKGYVGTGFDGLNRLNDFWAYSPVTGNWEKKAPLVSAGSVVSLARRDAVSFVVKGKGYVATGNDGSALKDVWQYDPVADSWSSKQSFGGSKRTEAVAFVIADKAYIVTGTNNGEYKNDFWMYDADADNWTKKRDIANVNEDEDYDNDYNIASSNGVAFVMNNKAYLTTGTKGGLTTHNWEYDPVNDLWTAVRDFEGVARTGAVAFVLKGTGHVSTGRTSSLQLDDLYDFTPGATYNKND